MNSDHVAIYCALTRIPSLDADAESGWSLLLSAAWKGTVTNGEEVREHLALWDWIAKPGSDEDEADLAAPACVGWWWDKDARTWEDLAGLAGIPWPLPPAHVPDRVERVRKRARTLLARVTDENLRIETVQPDGDESPTGTTDEVHVRHLLGDLSVQPAPAPQDLRLSWLMRAPATAPETWVLIAPILAGRRPKKPTDEPSAEVQYELEYEGETPPIVGYVFPVKVQAPARIDCIEPSGWIVCPDETSPWSDADVVRVLRSRWVDFLDHPRQLLKAARADSLDDEESAALRRVALALFRDRAGLGLKPDPDDDEIEDLLDRVVAAGLDIPSRDELRNRLLDWQGDLTLDSWIDALRVTLDPDGRLEVLNKDGLLLGQLDLLRQLDAILSRLADHARLGGLVRYQWESAIRDLAGADRVLELLDLVLTEVDLPSLLRDVERRPAFTEAVDQARRAAGKFLDELPEAIVATPDQPRLDARLEDPELEPPPPRRLPPRRPRVSSTDRSTLAVVTPKRPIPLVTRSISLLKQEVREDILRHAGLDDDAPSPYGPSTVTKTPHPVTVAVTRDGLEEDADVFELIHGYGLLMSRADEGGEPTGPWRVLNLAALKIQKGVIDRAAVVPLRLGYEDGLRQTRLTYENQPIAARSPAADLISETRWLKKDGEDDPSENVDAWLSREPVKVPSGDLRGEWALLPALVFGRNYAVAPYAVMNGGVLPQGLRDDTDPTRLKNFSGADPKPDVEPRKVFYRRRVPVGAPRLIGLPENARIDDVLPPVPADVAPRARELSDSEQADLASHGVAVVGGQPVSDQALAVLTPSNWPSHDGFDRTKIALRLGRPAVDIATWDRWVAFDGRATEREEKWAEFYRSVHKGLPTPVLEDPAVAPRFFLTWGELGKPRNLQAVGGALELQIRSGERTRVVSVDNSSTGVSARAELEAARGTVNLLRVQVGVTVDHWARFHPELESKRWGTRKDEDGKEYVLGPAIDLLVEVADEPSWITDTEAFEGTLFASLRVTERAEDNGSRLSVALTPPAVDDTPYSKILRDASGFVVRRQTWRWDGRVHDGFPFGDAGQNLVGSPAYLAWAATSFATRQDSDNVSEPGALSRLAKRQELLELPRVADRRALLFRFGLSVRSRYAGFRPQADLELEARVAVNDSDKVVTPWLPVFSGARPASAIPQPHVKLVVPLTEAEDESQQGSAPLLVVLREPWYETGGLAEELVAEVLQISVFQPFVPGSEEPPPAKAEFQLPQFGPDPLATGASWESAPSTRPKPQDTPTRPNENRQVAFDPHGPLGFTFDTDSSAPLFDNSSFLLNRPRVPEWAADRDLSHYMAQMRFRRRIEPAGIAGYSGLYTRTDHAIADGEVATHFAGALDPPIGSTHRLAFESIELMAGHVEFLVQGEPKRPRKPGQDANEARSTLVLRIDASGTLAWSGTAVGPGDPVVIGRVEGKGDLAIELRRVAEAELDVSVRVRETKTSGPWRQVGTVSLPVVAGSMHPLGVSAHGGAVSYRVRAARTTGGEHPIPIPESESTSPHHVQFLPASAAWVFNDTTNVFSVSHTRLLRQQNGRLQLLHDGQPVTAIRSRVPMPSGEPGHLESHPYLLVTELIHDARGRRDELFRWLAPINSEDGGCDVPSSSNESLRARLVEIQRITDGSDVPGHEEILDELFPPPKEGESDREARARILRVSPPIDIRS